MRTIRAGDRRAGFSLLEVAMALTLLTVIGLTAHTAILRSRQVQASSFDSFVAPSVLRDKVAEIQSIANEPQDLANLVGIGSVFAQFDGQSTDVPVLPSGTITVTCFPNESKVPDELGGPQDLNFDGDAYDDLGNQSKGTDLKLVPLELVVEFDAGQYTRSVSLYRLIGKTTD